MKKALIIGITGQDGSYLAKFLLSKDYKVYGLIRRSSYFNTSRIDTIRDKINLYYGDVLDISSLSNIISTVKPDEVYNLAAQSHVKVSFEVPQYTTMVNGIGTLNVIEAVRLFKPDTKIYQASTSELYGGDIAECPKNGFNEKSKFNPKSPYGISKLYAYEICKNYREAYNMFISNGILFNHESPLRGENFVSQKIVTEAIKIICGEKECMYLGNLDSHRDWGHAEDYVKAMWMILQHSVPDDFVVATGKTYTVREFAIKVFDFFGIEIKFEGEGINEVGKAKNDFGVIKKEQTLIRVDTKYFRPSDVNYLLGDSTKIRTTLKWKPKHNINSLIKDMILSKMKGL